MSDFNPKVYEYVDADGSTVTVFQNGVMMRKEGMRCTWNFPGKGWHYRELYHPGGGYESWNRGGICEVYKIYDAEGTRIFPDADPEGDWDFEEEFEDDPGEPGEGPGGGGSKEEFEDDPGESGEGPGGGGSKEEFENDPVVVKPKNSLDLTLVVVKPKKTQ